MVRVAVIAGFLAMTRWNPALLALSGLVTFIPAFAWADTGGRIRRRDRPRGTTEDHLRLFAWAWFFATIGFFGAVYLASWFQRINLSQM